MNRFEHRREHYVPQGATLQPCNGTDAAVYFYTGSSFGRPCAIGFAGRAQKPAFHIEFRNEERRTAHLAEYLEARQRRAKDRAELATARRAPHTLKVNDILVSSWGYDQTNVNFYKVTSIIGAQTVEIVGIGAETARDKNTGSDMADYVVAVPDQVNGKPMRKRANARNTVTVDSSRIASLWDGRPRYRSWYA